MYDLNYLVRSAYFEILGRSYYNVNWLNKRDFGTMSKGEAARQRIIDAANKLIYQQGYQATSLADVADAIGVTKGNLHYHFNSKEDLLDAVIYHRLEGISIQLQQWQQDYATPVERLKRFVQMLLNEEAQLVRFGCPMGSLNMELGKSQKSLQAKSLVMFQYYLTWLEKQFKQLDRQNGKALSQHLITMAQGAALMAYIYQDPKWLKQECKQIDSWIDSLSTLRS